MKKWILIIGLVIVGLLVVVGGIGYLWFQKNLEKALPQTSGELILPGLKENAEIIRDDYGIPHIYAKNEPDLYFALGYAMAQDRLWEMEFFRRLGQGRLSELFGHDFVKADRYFRMLTAAGVKKEISPESAFTLRSFAKGVNAYIEDHEDRPPIEFKLLGYKPEPWKADDYLAILKVVNWALSRGWRVDLTAGEILKKVGEKRLRDAFPVWPDDAPLIIPGESKGPARISNPTTQIARLVERLTPLPASSASNNWVISGERSLTGRPILANDTHLALTNPSFWWEVHLVCPGINVYGFALPGAPGVPIGHNLHVAWGITNVMVDDVDFYIEKINPENPRQYRYKDHWEEMEVVKERIRVKGKDPVKTEILLTRHGPIVTDVKAGPDEEVISARWSFNEGLQPAHAAYLLVRAKDIHGVKEALRYWELPGQNFVFADTRGNIGYWCCATIPIRLKGDGLLPMPGWTGEYGWKGYVPFEKRPHLLNPGGGIIATANNKVAGKGYPYFISRYWEPPDRITRIQELLKVKDKFSVDDFKRIQQDLYCPLASELTPKMLKALERAATADQANQAIEILSRWDFKMGKGSPGAALFEVTCRRMMDNIFKDELGDDLFERYLKTVTFPPRAIRRMIQNGSSPWFDNVNTPKKEGLGEIIALSLGQALSELRQSSGDDPEKWAWGHLHTLTFEHVLGKKRPLNYIFNLGPFPVGGSLLTVNKKSYPYEMPYQSNHGASMRMIVDLSNMGNSLHVLPTGESGQLKSPHFEDQIDLYLNGRYHKAWIQQGEIDKHSQGRLVLKPR